MSSLLPLPTRIITRSTRSQPILPFLYATRSISSPSGNKPPSDIPFVPAKESDPFSYLYTTPERPEGSERYRRASEQDTSSSSTTSSRGFRTDGASSTTDYRSSITLREREIFTKIFESILSSPSQSTRQSTSARSDDTDPKAKNLPTPPALRELFASTIGPQQDGDGLSFGPQHAMNHGSSAAMEAASKIAMYPPSIRAAAARAAGLTTWNPAQDLESEELKELKKGMRACASDVELLVWLEKNVYPLPMDHSNPKAALYSELISEGMEIFRTVYGDLGQVVAMFERVKKLGAESYVLGCTATVYNKALAAVWDGFGDLQRIRELVEEMGVNAVGGDSGTVKVVRRVCRDVEEAFDGNHGDLAAMMVGQQELKVVDSLLARASRLERYGSQDQVPVPKKEEKLKKAAGNIRRDGFGGDRRGGRDGWDRSANSNQKSRHQSNTRKGRGNGLPASRSIPLTVRKDQPL
ncbi:hypothetical protein BZA77DRAFT_317674 [Pyronema omphalodes]|nr:hypothetical protein BZA77DRAFT_317674 [Pyronema omphalodes]